MQVTIEVAIQDTSSWAVLICHGWKSNKSVLTNLHNTKHSLWNKN